MATTTALATEVAPEEVGLDPGRLARLDAYLDGFVANGRHKGSLLVITRGGRIAHVSHRGQRDAEAGLPVEPDTIWRIYSMTKPITSVAAMMLYEEGALSLFDPVAKFIPSFGDLRVYRHGMAAAPVTVRAAEPMLVWHLLTHTSGLTYGFQQANAVDEAYRAAGFFLDPPPEHDLASACDVWAGLPLLFEPGRRVELLGVHRRAGEDHRGRLRPVAGRVLRRAHLRAAGHDRHRLLGLRRRPPADDRALRPRPGDGHRRPLSRGRPDLGRAARSCWPAGTGSPRPPPTTTASRRCCCAVASSTACACWRRGRSTS